MKRALPALALAGLLSACAAAPQTPAQAVFALEATYDAALDVAVAYAMLPRCAPAAPPLCSDAAMARKVNDVAHQAWVAIRAAQSFARGPKADPKEFAAARAGAQAALTELSALIATLKVN